jgi:hypothetical protein
MALNFEWGWKLRWYGIGLFVIYVSFDFGWFVWTYAFWKFKLDS